jgi:hypothetical protein
MVEILNFKKEATIIKLYAAVTILNVWGILMSHCRRDKNTENIPLNWLSTMPRRCMQKWGYSTILNLGTR